MSQPIDLQKELLHVEVMEQLKELLANEEWTFGQFYIGDIVSMIQIMMRETSLKLKVSDLGDVKKHTLTEDAHHFTEAEKQYSLKLKVAEIMKDVTVGDALSILDSFTSNIDKRKNQIVGPLTIDQLDIKLPTKEQIHELYEKSQSEHTEPTPEASV
jgi:hypothetical protein